ncbi:MAG: DUF1684 domain-containing protein [Myxococcales bacterium]|nr:DUF1684 domain-containing protein [Myxococcales bacterium]
MTKAPLLDAGRVLGPIDVQRQRAAFREEQDALLRSELSPLARVDYVHLTAGEHRLSTAVGAALRVPADALSGPLGQVSFVAAPPSAVRLVADPPVKLDGVLQSQAVLRKGQVISLGLLRLLCTGTDADPALAVYDLGSPARREYRGLRYYPDDDRFRVAARLQRYAQPKAVHLPASRGDDKDLQAVGTLQFRLPPSQDESMEAYLEQPGSTRLFLIFRDGTSGKKDGSYGAGRFLYAQLGSDDTVWLDFNQAWNPLCAYSAYFHCPLPPRSNWLKSQIPVGEKVYSEH